jgi:hypothetical protein
MGHLNLADAFALFGGKPLNRLYGLSAMAADGAMILSCSGGSYGHPAPGVLRYEDRLSRATERPTETQRLGEHLALARDGVPRMRAGMPARNARLPRGPDS